MRCDAPSPQARLSSIARPTRRSTAQSPTRKTPIGGPTAADDVAHAIIRVAQACEQPRFTGWGTYHFSGTPPVSWYEFARAIVEKSGTAVLPISTEEFPRPACRPLNSVLDCSRFL